VNVAWIGAGVMGRSMAGHLLARGHRVVVHSRTQSKAADLLAAGATWADSPAEAAAEAEVSVVMVGLPVEVDQVMAGPRGLLSGVRPGSLVVDMGTGAPAAAVAMAAACAARGVGFLDAPVSGGDVGARNATLTIMVGGDADGFARALPLFEAMGRSVRRQGPAGAGMQTKMVNQILIATTMIGLCEALVYARRAGLDPAAVLESVGSGAAGSWSLANYGPRILAGDFAPGFRIDHFVKDLGLALADARRLRLALPGLALAEQLYVAAQAQGLGANGTQALWRVIDGLSPAPVS
jgi:3-hydroxyisobutyrate dehydrogenase